MIRYRPTLLYVIKIFGLIICAAFSIFIISVFIDIVTFFVKSSFFEKISGIFLLLVLLIAAIRIIRSNNPSISFANDYMIVGYQEVKYDDIKKFYPSKGGSEPYIITKDNHKIDLEISWFRKKDRLEIEKGIAEKMNLSTKTV